MTVVVSRRAQKSMRRHPAYILRRIDKIILSLEKNPHPANAVKLKGVDGFRIRAGEYRIVYYVEKKTIHIADVASRQRIYKALRL